MSCRNWWPSHGHSESPALTRSAEFRIELVRAEENDLTETQRHGATERHANEDWKLLVADRSRRAKVRWMYSGQLDRRRQACRHAIWLLRAMNLTPQLFVSVRAKKRVRTGRCAEAVGSVGLRVEVTPVRSLNVVLTNLKGIP